MDIRKIIREEISRMFQEEDATLNTGNDVLGGAMNDIGAMLQKDIDNIAGIVNTQTTSLKNDQAVYKQDNQKKNTISNKIGDIDNPEKKGLEREMPLRNQLNIAKDKQLKDLVAAQKGLVAAQSDLQKKQAEIEKQAQQQAKATGKTSTPSILPSLQSPI